MHTHPFFSIIIPVYNGVTNDLPICLESIWNQPLDKDLYEVICIDDCSSDSTYKWLQEQQEAHGNLRIIKNEINIRQGASRNKGVKVARGKYILFIDSDDYFHEGSISKIYEILKGSDIEILVSDSAYQFKGHPHNNLQLNLPYRDKTDGETFVKKNGWAIAPWRLCFNKDFYNKNSIAFVEGTRVEDVDWGVRMMYHAQKIQYQPILLVHYIKGESGTSDTMYKNKTTLIDNIEAANRVIELAETLYRESPNKQYAIDLADTYYNRTTSYLFGLFSAINTKKEILAHIKYKNSRYRLVKTATGHPTLFAIASNCMVPAFRLARFIRRKRTAKGLKAKNSKTCHRKE